MLKTWVGDCTQTQFDENKIAHEYFPSRWKFTTAGYGTCKISTYIKQFSLIQRHSRAQTHQSMLHLVSLEKPQNYTYTTMIGHLSEKKPRTCNSLWRGSTIQICTKKTHQKQTRWTSSYAVLARGSYRMICRKTVFKIDPRSVHKLYSEVSHDSEIEPMTAITYIRIQIFRSIGNTKKRSLLCHLIGHYGDD